MDGSTFTAKMTRRAMLQRLGLGASAVYTAPALLSLTGAARASSGDSGGGGSAGSSSGGRGGNAGGGNSGGGGRGGGGGRSSGGRASAGRSSAGRNESRRRRPRRQVRQQRSTREAQAQRRRPPPPPPPEFVVLLPDGTVVAPIEALGYGIVARRPNQVLAGEVMRLRAPAGRTLEQARAEVSSVLPVRALDLNALYRPNAILCEDGECAAFEMIDWRPGRQECGVRPRIGMIDTRVNPDQPALAGQRLTVLDVDRGDRPNASALHGTAIATLLIGRADSRTPGLLPNAELVAVNAFFATGSDDAADAYAIAEAVDILVAREVGVINMSFAGPPNDVLAELVERAAQAGVAFVAAAGNGGPLADPAYPAAYPAVIAVTAVDRQEKVYRQANRGDYITFAAPGVNLWTAASISGGRLRSGTSYAAPFVTAALAARRAEAPHEPMADSLALLARNARDLGEAGPDATFGHGVISGGFLCEAQG